MLVIVLFGWVYAFFFFYNKLSVTISTFFVNEVIVF